MNTTCLKSLVLCLSLSLFTQSGLVASNNNNMASSQHACSHASQGSTCCPSNNVMQSVDSFTGRALKGVSSAVALGGLATGSYQFVKAMQQWLKANCAEDEFTQQELKDQRNESLRYSLAALSIAGIAYALPRVDMTALVMHIDLGVLFAAVINALAKK